MMKGIDDSFIAEPSVADIQVNLVLKVLKAPSQMGKAIQLIY